jgi:hypothetical protein
VSRKSPVPTGETPAATRRRFGAAARASALTAVLAAGLAPAYGAGRGGFEAAAFALALVGAVAGASALLAVRARDRRVEQIARELAELAESQRRTLSDAAERKPELRVLFLNGHAGVSRARIVRRRPRPLDIEHTVAFERALALRTLPSAKLPLSGSLEVYRRPTEHDREAFRETVEAYAEALRDALTRHDAYRKERATLVSGRFRFENNGRRSAHNMTVSAHFPDPFEAAGHLLGPPAFPARPTFHGRRAALAALLGGEARRARTTATSTPARAAAGRLTGGVSRPTYRPGSALVEVGVDELPPSATADMHEGAGWVLRLTRPGEYRIGWEAACEELAEPARGELHLEVEDVTDDTPIRSLRELFAEADAPDEGATFAPDIGGPIAGPGGRRFA